MSIVKKIPDERNMSVIESWDVSAELLENNDPICSNNEDIQKTVNIFLSAVENLMNRNNWTYKELKLDQEKQWVIWMIEKSSRQLVESQVKRIAHTITGRVHENLPSFSECLAEETELKLIQYRRTQEEQRAIEKSAIKAKYLAEKLDIPVNNLKYMKHLFYDLARKKIASRYINFSKKFAWESENLDEEWVYIRETELKKEEIDNRIKTVLKHEAELLNQVAIEYPFFIKDLAQKYEKVFERKPKISFHDIFWEKTQVWYKLSVRVEVPIEDNKNDDKSKKRLKTKVDYKTINVNIKLRDAIRFGLINKSVRLDRKELNDFLKNMVDSSDAFWMLHIGILKTIQQEAFKIQQEKREK